MKQNHLFVLAGSRKEFNDWVRSQDINEHIARKRILYAARIDYIYGIKRGCLFLVLDGFHKRDDVSRFDMHLKAKDATFFLPRPGDSKTAERYLKLVDEHDI